GHARLHGRRQIPRRTRPRHRPEDALPEAGAVQRRTRRRGGAVTRGRGDTVTRGHGDTETRRRTIISVSPRLPVSPSPRHRVTASPLPRVPASVFIAYTLALLI